MGVGKENDGIRCIAEAFAASNGMNRECADATVGYWRTEVQKSQDMRRETGEERSWPRQVGAAK